MAFNPAHFCLALSNSPSFLNQHFKTFTVNNTEDKDRTKKKLHGRISRLFSGASLVLALGWLQRGPCAHAHVSVWGAASRCKSRFTPAWLLARRRHSVSRLSRGKNKKQSERVRRLQRGACGGSTQPPDQYSISAIPPHPLIIVARCSGRPVRRISPRTGIVLIGEK